LGYQKTGNDSIISNFPSDEYSALGVDEFSEIKAELWFAKEIPSFIEYLYVVSLI